MTSRQPSKTHRIRTSRVGVALLGAASITVADASKQRAIECGTAVEAARVAMPPEPRTRQ